MHMKHVFSMGAVGLALSLAALAAPPSLVADAAAKGDAVALRTLIGQKADVNGAQPDGATALQWAAFKNDLAMADMLIAAGADPKKANRDGATPLSLASINGSAPMIEKLLKAGVDPNEKHPRGETALMFAARNGNLDAIKLLLDNKAEINAKESVRGTTALMWATEQEHPAAIKLLLANGADVAAVSSPDTKGNRAYLAPTVQARLNSAQGAGGLGNGRGAAGRAAPPPRPARTAAPPGNGDAGEEDVVAAADAAAAQFSFGRQTDKDGGGMTPLVIAARENCLECVKALLEGGAGVNQTTRYGWSPLLTATKNGFYQVGKFLLDHGADPNLQNKGGWSPLYLATDNRNIEGGDYPVRPADMDHMEFIKLLIAKGANVNARVCGVQSTPAKCVAIAPRRVPISPCNGCTKTAQRHSCAPPSPATQSC